MAHLDLTKDVLYLDQAERDALRVMLEHELDRIHNAIVGGADPTEFNWEPVWALALAVGVDCENPPYWA